MLIINLIIVCALIILAGILSSIETSVAATNKEKILQSEPDISLNEQKRINKLLPQKEKIITSILITFNALQAIATTIMASCLIEVLGKDKGRGITAIIMPVASILFAEILPKIIAVSNPEYIVLRTTYLMRVLLIICLPFNFVLDYVTPVIHKIFNAKMRKKK